MVVDNDDWQSLQDTLKVYEGKILDYKIVLKSLALAYESACLDHKLNPNRELAYVKAKEITKDI